MFSFSLFVVVSLSWLLNRMLVPQTDKEDSKNSINFDSTAEIVCSECDETMLAASLMNLSDKEIKNSLVGTIVVRDFVCFDPSGNEIVKQFEGQVTGMKRKTKSRHSKWKVIYEDGDEEFMSFRLLKTLIQDHFMECFENQFGNDYDAWPAMRDLFIFYVEKQNLKALTKGQKGIFAQHFRNLRSVVPSDSE